MSVLDRRVLLTSAAAAGVAAAVPGWAQPAQAPASASGGADERLDALLTRQFYDDLEKHPEGASSLGLDSGERAALKSRLSDRSQRGAGEDRADVQRKWAELRRLGETGLSAAGRTNYEVAAFRLQTAAEAASRFNYGNTGGRPVPYVVSQLSGAYYQVPDFLDTQHKIDTGADVDAYLSRLQAFATGIDGDTERVNHDAAAGVIPPDFVLAKALTNIRHLRDGAPEQSGLVTSVARRAREKGLADPTARATSIVTEQVRPALDRQIAALTALQPRATHEAGVWRLPQGEAFYALGIKANTTTTMTGEEIHQLGLQQVGELQGRIDAILRTQGMTQGTVGARLEALNTDARYLFPNTDAGKEALLASLNGIIADVTGRLPRVFSTLPRARLEIRRVPPAIELSAPGGYYNGAPLDNSRPGIYWINLKETGDWARWRLPTLCYHEGIPGHHFQISVSREAGSLPIYRRAGGYSAYAEGWALYAERLADELGVYENNPLGKVGFLQSYLFRATRLVVDSGMHHKRWSREQAIQYMRDNSGEPANATEVEIERYVVWPGQACAYKVGENTISRLRAGAERRLGARFDIKSFHDAVLLSGSLPLTVLERIVGDWVSGRAA